MNERIKELAEQAKKYALDAMIKITDKEQALKVYSETYDTKFAELIVGECLAQIDKIRDGCEEDGEGTQALGADWAGLAVARHFGVEE
jgi:hypothetical protein